MNDAIPAKLETTTIPDAEGFFGRSFRFNHAGLIVDVAAYTFSAPASFKNLTSWQYRLSKTVEEPGPWVEKGQKDETFQNRCFHSVYHARKAAMQAARETPR